MKSKLFIKLLLDNEIEDIDFIGSKGVSNLSKKDLVSFKKDKIMLIKKA